MDLTPFIFLEALLLHPSHKNQGGGGSFGARSMNVPPITLTSLGNVFGKCFGKI